MDAQPKARLLLVDDVPANLLILSEALKQEYEILTAGDGPEALRLAGTSPLPDLILLDVMMPGMDGYEVCRRLGADPRTAGIPVIFVTGLEEEENETRGLSLGAVDYLTKPIRPAIARARVKNHLELKRQRDFLRQELVISEQEYTKLFIRPPVKSR